MEVLHSPWLSHGICLALAVALVVLWWDAKGQRKALLAAQETITSLQDQLAALRGNLGNVDTTARLCARNLKVQVEEIEGHTVRLGDVDRQLGTLARVTKGHSVRLDQVPAVVRAMLAPEEPSAEAGRLPFASLADIEANAPISLGPALAAVEKNIAVPPAREQLILSRLLPPESGPLRDPATEYGALTSAPDAASAAVAVEQSALEPAPASGPASGPGRVVTSLHEDDLARVDALAAEYGISRKEMLARLHLADNEVDAQRSPAELLAAEAARRLEALAPPDSAPLTPWPGPLDHVYAAEARAAEIAALPAALAPTSGAPSALKQRLVSAAQDAPRPAPPPSRPAPSTKREPSVLPARTAHLRVEVFPGPRQGVRIVRFDLRGAPEQVMVPAANVVGDTLLVEVRGEGGDEVAIRLPTVREETTDEVARASVTGQPPQSGQVWVSRDQLLGLPALPRAAAPNDDASWDGSDDDTKLMVKPTAAALAAAVAPVAPAPVKARQDTLLGLAAPKQPPAAHTPAPVVVPPPPRAIITSSKRTTTTAIAHALWGTNSRP
jgi:hypothetical protein